ncbi:DinB family protein [Paenibacillus tyrfis]|uniref:DinB family protein n=1 Tax=Paenibacillus tyrfis TaxID=1501230 RepID=UPI000B58AD2C|nr:DinB family protein [Paenibacillus tyrfis]
MEKHIFFVHSGGAQGSPGQGSFDLVEWLRCSLEEEYRIHYPIIEKPEEPTYGMWKAMFDKEFPNLVGEVILIGHSLGGSMLLKYLSEVKIEFQIKALFLIAIPFWGESGWSMDDFDLKNHFSKHLPVLPTVHFFHSFDDKIVPFQHVELYKSHFPNAIIHKINGNDHAFVDGLPKLVEQINIVHLNSEIIETKKELLQVISLFNDYDINTIPAFGGWSAGQILEHITKAVSPEILYGMVKKSDRRHNEKLKAIKRDFLDFNSKMKSPDFIEPTESIHYVEDMILKIEKKFETLIEASNTLDLSEICIEFTLPVYGEFTRLEWIYFFMYHIQRHIYQLKKVSELKRKFNGNP